MNLFFFVLCRLPQLVYPSRGATPNPAFLPAAAVAATTPAALTALPAPHAPLTAHALATIGHPLIEYSTLAFAAAPHQLHAAGLDTAFQTATPTAGFLAQSSTSASLAFTPLAYAAPPPPASTPGVQLGHQLAAASAHYKPLSIQDRM